MMNILIPMAGAGSRFKDQGYKIHKPLLPTTSLSLKKTVPMVVAAWADLPRSSEDKTIFVIRKFHEEEQVPFVIKQFVSNSQFIVVSDLTEGQACTCLLAKNQIDNDQELLISGCDNGLVFDHSKFISMKAGSEVLVFTFRNHEHVLQNPQAYGWVKTNGENSTTATGVSVKKALSSQPMRDHAVVATFWFKKGSDFVRCAEEMISSNDRINNEFYVDQVIKYAVRAKLNVKVFEVEKYLGWGTPADYEQYEKTVKYWKDFLVQEEKNA